MNIANDIEKTGIAGEDKEQTASTRRSAGTRNGKLGTAEGRHGDGGSECTVDGAQNASLRTLVKSGGSQAPKTTALSAAVSQRSKNN
ncbi:hypothetical protein SAMN02745157_4512 [Kaistia soli DSM 19436]|uniref:Uncharacterized protein n=1 Tax=Kaistia soli DSM 19436 TaxID=1122133 RepID=A0A1M5L707_9HYPH|nr:hypothetical protein [Kaistia soli]SHG60746.1 hypothetical protein SAMN02745157_4512 [Kaistia soli DSM 19436]